MLSADHPRPRKCGSLEEGRGGRQRAGAGRRRRTGLKIPVWVAERSPDARSWARSCARARPCPRWGDWAGPCPRGPGQGTYPPSPPPGPTPPRAGAATPPSPPPRPPARPPPPPHSRTPPPEGRPHPPPAPRGPTGGGARGRDLAGGVGGLDAPFHLGFLPLVGGPPALLPRGLPGPPPAPGPRLPLRPPPGALRRGLAGRARAAGALDQRGGGDRKSTRLNSSHQIISYAVFCLKKKKKHTATDVANRVGPVGLI